MSRNSLAIPTTIASPRCFFLPPVINKTQAYTQAGEHKSRVFNFDLRNTLRAFAGRRGGIEADLLERRLVPFWHISCKSHFDYTRMKDYVIAASTSDAVSVIIQGNDSDGNPIELVYRVDQSGRSGGQVRLTGTERCVTDRSTVRWVDSYVRTEDWVSRDLDLHEKNLQDTAKQRPLPINDLVEFGSNLSIDGQLIFDDQSDIKTIIVPPLETADNVVRRILQTVMVPIEAATIYDWSLEVTHVDLYFRPLYVFEFTRLDPDGNPIERKLEELDALHKDNWVNLQATEYQMPTVPWLKILRLSTDIGMIMLQDTPVIGTTLKIASTVAKQMPGILHEDTD